MGPKDGNFNNRIEFRKNSNHLEEKDFIHEGVRKDPSPLWTFFFLSLSLLVFFAAISHSYSRYINEEQSKTPFLRVTNRDFSLFVWHNPEFMRINSKDKLSYLPDFEYIEKLTLDPRSADKWVIAPPEVLFVYHTWERQIKDELPLYTPTKDLFLEFISYAEEWQPENWKQGPKDYVELIRKLRRDEKIDFILLPQEVKIAYTGWLNFTRFGQKINDLMLKAYEIDLFLKDHPHYARPYWRNLLLNTHPEYLYHLPSGDEIVSIKKISPFFKAACFTIQAI